MTKSFLFLLAFSLTGCSTETNNYGDGDTGGSNEDNTSELPDGTFYDYDTATDDTADTDTDSGSDAEVEVKWYLDQDGDGYGYDLSYVWSVDAPSSSYTLIGGDCNPTDDLTFPGAAELETGTDAALCMTDADADGYGDEDPVNGVWIGTDCNDGSSSTHPGAGDTASDGIDQNCDGVDTAASATYTYYQDSDGDGDGNAAVWLSSTSQPSGYVANSTDCNDANSAIHPGATDTTDDNIDNDCDGSVDEDYVAPSTACSATQGLVVVSFTAPVGSTISSISGEAVGGTNAFSWTTLTTGTPSGMTVTTSASDGTTTSAKNRVTASYANCVDDTSAWNASVTYTTGTTTSWDCVAMAFTGTWSATRDGVVDTVAAMSNGGSGCDAGF
jgi:hypothetical protein